MDTEYNTDITMRGLEILGQIGRMRRDWDRRARENARHFVATGRREWTEEEFLASGRAEVQEQILNDLHNVCRGMAPRTMKVLEIGCGAGRVTRALAEVFGEVYAVDISGEMVRRARVFLADTPNAHVIRNNGKDLRALKAPWWRRFGSEQSSQFDFAFSIIVFQHIASREIIANYVREVHRLLKPGALFKFQVQGRPVTETERQGSWVGASFTEAQARSLAENAGFDMRYHSGAGEQYYWLWFFKK